MNNVTNFLLSSEPEWQQLSSLAKAICEALDAGENLRLGPPAVVSACGIEVDSERIRLNAAALHGLNQLARARGIEARRDAMFAGSIVNVSERRAALHVALRAREGAHPGLTITRSVMTDRERMRALAERLHAGSMQGSTGESIHNIVNIGIGGSDFGSRLLCDALSDLAPSHLRVHFVSGVDGIQIERLCRTWEPQRTVFIVSSKSFSTPETLLNARTLLDRFNARSLNIADHWFAVTGNANAAQRLGIPRSNVFDIPEWVGGRFSAWGAVGLAAALYLGWPVFERWLAGGVEMDEHHLAAPVDENLPVRLALHNIWHSTFLGCPSHCIASYDNRLANFLTWAQQLEMESNQSVTEDGRPWTIQRPPSFGVASETTVSTPTISFYERGHSAPRSP